jgi:hypothetical protein
VKNYINLPEEERKKGIIGGEEIERYRGIHLLIVPSWSFARAFRGNR